MDTSSLANILNSEDEQDVILGHAMYYKSKLYKEVDWQFFKELLLRDKWREVLRSDMFYKNEINHQDFKWEGALIRTEGICNYVLLTPTIKTIKWI